MSPEPQNPEPQNPEPQNPAPQAPEPGSPDPGADPAPGSDEAKARAARRRRLAEVFGDDLPDQTSDDLPDRPTRGRDGEDPSEEWLRRQVPPHHG